MYSGNSYRNDSYFVGYAIADGDVQDLRDLVFKKYPNDYEYHPILSKNEICQGTGHNSVIKTKGKYYIVYHGRFYNRIDRLNDDRKLFINELIVNKENLTVK
jgi:GH43 family beta-xylosidase